MLELRHVIQLAARYRYRPERARPKEHSLARSAEILGAEDDRAYQVLMASCEGHGGTRVEKMA